MAAQDDLAPAAGARALDHGAQVVQLQLQAPVGDELRVLARHPVVLEAEVVVERRVRVATREHRRVLEGLLAAVDDPDLRARHPPDDVARDRHDPTGAALRARHEHQHLRRVGRTELLHPDAVVLRRPRRRRHLHRDVAVDRRRGAARHHEGSSQGQAHGATLHRVRRLDSEQVERPREHALGEHRDGYPHVLVAALLGRADHAAVAVERREVLGRLVA